MSKWATVTLEGVTTDGSDGLRRGPFGGAIKKDSFVPDGYKIYEQRHAIYGDFEAGSYFIGDRRYRELKSFAVMPGDLIVSCSGTLGRVAIVPSGAKPGIINQALLRIRPKPDVLSSRFFKMLLETPEIQSRLFGSAGGSAIKNVRPLSEIRKVEFQLPPLAEQRRIAEGLDRAEVLRAKRRAALAQLDTLTQSIFHHIFGDPAANPMGWPIRRIGDLLLSATYGTSKKAAATGEFAVLRMNNITRTGEMDLNDLKYMDLDTSEQSRYLVTKGDVLFNRTNSAELVGKTAIVRELQPMAYAGYLVRLRVNAENDPEYLVRFLNTGYAKKMLRGMCKSIIGMANINAKEIQEVKVAQPPKKLQGDFARRVTAIEKLRASHRASLTKLDTLFAVLQYRAFRGEL